MKKSSPDNDLMDELVDIYSTMDQSYIDTSESGKESIVVRCKNNRVYRIRIEFVTNTQPLAPWSN